MLEDASTLLGQKKETEAKQQLLDSFCKHFLVSDADLTTLTNSVEPVSERFFEVLSRVKQIHKDCEILLGYENQRLGLELMEQTTRDLNAGYKKLFNSTLREFKGLDLEDPHISGSIRRSLRALSERPALFQSCLDSFAEARQSTVSDGFQKALTDSTLGTARAIDFSTHDPLRYIGDMLAWVHSATVSEMEALEGLFISDADEISRGLHQGKSEDPFSMANTADDEDGEQDMSFDGRAALNALISRNMASVAHTLTQRISVTIRSLSEPVEIYKAYNVICFYHDMFLKLIRTSTKTSPATEEPNSLLSTLTDLQSQTFKHFETATLEALHSSTDETPKADLSPPSILSETLSQFSTIARTRGPNLDLPEFTKLYGTLLAPVINSCASLADIATGQPSATSTTKTIYKLNYLSLVRDTLTQLTTGTNAITAAEKPLGSAKSEIESSQTKLQDMLSDTFLGASGLGQLRRFIDETRQANASLTRQRSVLLKIPVNQTVNRTHDLDESESKLESLAHHLDSFLASALTDTQDDLGKLTDKTIARVSLNKAVETFVSRFEMVVGMLEEIDEGFEREKLARRMGKSKGRDVDVDVDVDVNGEDQAEESDSDADGADEEEEPVKLRDVYPRLVSEVEALLS